MSRAGLQPFACPCLGGEGQDAWSESLKEGRFEPKRNDEQPLLFDLAVPYSAEPKPAFMSEAFVGRGTCFAPTGLHHDHEPQVRAELEVEGRSCCITLQHDPPMKAEAEATCVPSGCAAGQRAIHLLQNTQ